MLLATAGSVHTKVSAGGFHKGKVQFTKIYTQFTHSSQGMCAGLHPAQEDLKGTLFFLFFSLFEACGFTCWCVFHLVSK